MNQFLIEGWQLGEAVPVLDGNTLLDAWECPSFGRWYEPPISREYLAKCLRVNAHHQSCITKKRQMLECA